MSTSRIIIKKQSIIKAEDIKNLSQNFHGLNQDNNFLV